MMLVTKLLLALLGASSAVGCQSLVPDAPPPASSGDIALAAPLSLGAMAAGTDGAPLPNPISADPRSGRPELVPDPDSGGLGDSGDSGDSGQGGEASAPGAQAVPL